jgi:hypothetical protein
MGTELTGRLLEPWAIQLANQGSPKSPGLADRAEDGRLIDSSTRDDLELLPANHLAVYGAFPGACGKRDCDSA